MNRTRIALLGLLAVLVAVWVSSASLPSAPPDDGAAARAAEAAARRPEPPLFDLQAVNGRLEGLRAHAPQPHTAGRNPFEFGATPPRRVAAPSAAPRAAAAAAAAAAPAAPPPLPLTLAGIVERTEPQGKMRTAVLSGLGQVFFGKPGDTLATRYEVVAVGVDAVELRDTVTNQTHRLPLP